MKTIQEIVLSKKGVYTGTAIETSGSSVSYEEFDRQTEELAIKLIKRGAGPGEIVLLHMERSISMVIAMFAILKTGAAFSPLAMDVPEARLKSAAASSGCLMIMDDALYEELAGQSVEGMEFIPCMADPRDPGIVLFTSGSTGTPKGVVQTQTGTAHLFMQFPYNLRGREPAVQEFDTVIARLSHAFIVAYHYEYPVAILNGKKLVLLDESERFSINDTVRLMEENSNIAMAVLPSQLSIYMEEQDFVRAMRNVKCLCFFAEPVPETLLNKILTTPDFTGSVVSVFGSTETFGIGWQDFRSGRGMLAAEDSVVRIIDEDGNTLPIGELGELVVQTPSMFVKYLLEDRQTAEETFRNKNIELDGVRFVRPGDLARLTPEGGIRLYGRTDRMVKYHGQRIELAEIESVLNAQPGIRSSCALVLKTAQGIDVLTAFYEGDHNQDIDTATLRQQLSARMPIYMVPVCYKRLDSLPLNSNGKVDYTTLKNMPIDYQVASNDRELTEDEHTIAREVASLLQLDENIFKADSSLVAMGLDSLNSALLISRLEKQGLRLGIDDLIGSDTLEQVAQRLVRVEKKQHVRKNVSALVECTDMQAKWYKMELQIVSLITAFKGIEEAELADRLDALSQLHPILRSSFIDIDGRTYTKVLKSRPVHYEYMDIRYLGDEAQEVTKAQRSMILFKNSYLFTHPNKEDLLYVAAFRTHDDRTVLSLRFDHGAFDGMSSRIIMNDLLRDELSEESDNYIEYLEYTGDAAVRQEAMDFWREYLHGASPTDFPKNPAPRGEANYKEYKYTIAGDEAVRLKELCKSLNISVSAFMLYQYARAVMETAGIDDTFVFFGASGRSVAVEGMDQMAGCLVNAIPVRIRRGDTEHDFMKSMLRADRYGFLPREYIYRECFGTSSPAVLPPYIVSQIFPERLNENNYEDFKGFVFNRYDRGDFLWEDEGGIHLTLHPDVDLWDAGWLDSMWQRLVENTERRLG